MDTEHKQAIRNWKDTHGRLPSYAELMKLTRFSSRSSIFKLIGRLTQEGFLSKDKKGHIAPGPSWSPLRVLGLIEAGFPSPAEEDTGEHLSLDEYLMPNRDASYMLRVKGDSMKDAGIVEGDMVIVERVENAKVGSIVIAEVDGQWTMKYYRSKNGKAYLEAANPAYKDIYPKEGLKIAAIVRGVIRKY